MTEKTFFQAAQLTKLKAALSNQVLQLTNIARSREVRRDPQHISIEEALLREIETTSARLASDADIEHIAREFGLTAEDVALLYR